MENINTFISGVIVFRIGKDYIYVKPPSAEDKTFADFFSNELYEESLTESLWTKEDAIKLAIDCGLWDDAKQKKLDSLPELIDNMKIDYFKNFFNSGRKETIRRAIEDHESQLVKLSSDKNTFIDKTVDYLRIHHRILFLIEKTAYLYGGGLACEKYTSQIIANIYTTKVSELNSQTRSVAKSPEWRNIWHGSKENLFENKPSSFTDVQQSIISWSYYYDGVYQSMEKPADEVIEDDFAIDGWAISERRKRDEEDKKKSAEQILPKNISGAGEVFIPVRNQKEAEDVYRLNDRAGQAKLKSLQKDLNKNGVLDDSQLTSTQTEIQMMANKIGSQRR